MYKIKKFIADFLCAIGIHEWIYRINKENIAQTRYCPRCARQEQYAVKDVKKDKTVYKYVRIRDIKWDEMD